MEVDNLKRGGSLFEERKMVEVESPFSFDRQVYIDKMVSTYSTVSNKYLIYPDY